MNAKRKLYRLLLSNFLVAATFLLMGSETTLAQSVCSATPGIRIGPSDGGSMDQLGTSVAVRGNMGLMGAPGRTTSIGGTFVSKAGMVYVATQTGNSWTIGQQLTASDPTRQDGFGTSVDFEGTWAVIGAPANGMDSVNGGSAYVFQLNGANWVYRQKLVVADREIGDYFGSTVAIAGSTIVVGSSGKQGYTGAAYVYRLNGSTWTLSQTLTAPDGAPYDFFGGSVDISGNVILVGAYGDDVTGTNSGSAYVYRSNGTTWSYSQKLLPPDGVTADNFGWSVAVDGANAVLGAPDDDDKGTSSGSAYVFHDSGSSWSQVTKLLASDGGGYDWFGRSVAVSGSGILIGASKWTNDAAQTPTSGTAYYFTLDGTWQEQLNVVQPAPWGYDQDHLGGAVALDGETALVGAPDEDPPALNSGKAYFFEMNCTEGEGDCVLHSDCDDGNACTTDTCEAGGICRNVNAANGTACNDGLFCNGADSCSAGACSVHAGNPCSSGAVCANTCNEAADNCFSAANVACTADTNACTNDVCNGSGLCTHPNKPAGSACGSSAADLCDNPDTCNASGVCLTNNLANGAACADDGNDCTTDTCSAGTCTHPAKANNTACTADTNSCTNDVCTSGVCTHPNKPAGSACGSSAAGLCDNADTCSATGVCLTNNLTNGAACADDGNDCTTDTCSAGTCTHPAKANNTACTADTNSCTNDVCTSGVCTHPNKPAGTACGSSTSSLCDNADTCSATGVCLTNNLANGAACADDGNDCTTDTCSAGTCTHPAKANNTACTADTNSCTNDVCTSGVCTHPNKPAGTACGSSSASPCDNPDTCNAAGACLTNILANGAACADDGNDCTTDTCSAGTCTHPAKANNTACTADTNSCTNDVCTSGVCTHPNKPSGSACGSSTSGPCDNADMCNSSGVCLANNRPNGTACPDDGNACTNDTCSAGSCTHPVKANGTACNDGSICTELDACLSGTCRGGPAVTCDDSDPCTTDICMPLTGCVADPIDCPAGQTCVDGVCSSEYCNDGVCAADEDACNCPADCQTFEALCGNGICDVYVGEDCHSCPDDCRSRLTGPLNKQFCCGDDKSPKGASCSASACNSRGWVCEDAPPCR